MCDLPMTYCLIRSVSQNCVHINQIFAAIPDDGRDYEWMCRVNGKPSSTEHLLKLRIVGDMMEMVNNSDNIYVHYNSSKGTHVPFTNLKMYTLIINYPVLLPFYNMQL